MDVLTSLAVICLLALSLGALCARLRLPPLLGMLIVGILLGPYVLDGISPTLLAISGELRQVALIIILMRAGLNLNLKDVKQNGVAAALMCFVPASVEIVAYTLLGRWLLGLTYSEAAILGCVMAAVSPAVVVPRMLSLKEQKLGTDKGIPDMIMTGASADDVYTILLFTSLVAMEKGGSFSLDIAWKLPVSIVAGVGAGVGAGLLFAWFVRRVHLRDSVKVILLLSFSFLFVSLENTGLPFSGLLAVISFGASFFAAHAVCAARLSQKFSRLWVFAEILLFVLVGAQVNIGYALQNCGPIIGVVLLATAFRMGGVCLCVAGSKLNAKEKLFCAIAYMPKATVQAAIGSLPLSMGLACGETVLTAAVLGILITAPLGAFLTDLLGKRLLRREESPQAHEAISDV